MPSTVKVDGKRAGERVALIRTHLGINRSELARRAKVSRTYLGMLERGEIGTLRPNTQTALAAALRWPDFESLVASEALEPGVPVETLEERVARLEQQRIPGPVAF